MSKTKPATKPVAATPAAATFALSVKLEESSWGTPRPVLSIRTARSDSRQGFRSLRAEMHRVAAEVEYASQAHGASWVACCDHHSDTLAQVWLDLADGTRQEADQGVEVLRAAAAAYQILSR